MGYTESEYQMLAYWLLNLIFFSFASDWCLQGALHLLPLTVMKACHTVIMNGMKCLCVDLHPMLKSTLTKSSQVQHPLTALLSASVSLVLTWTESLNVSLFVAGSLALAQPMNNRSSSPKSQKNLKWMHQKRCWSSLNANAWYHWCLACLDFDQVSHDIFILAGCCHCSSRLKLDDEPSHTAQISIGSPPMLLICCSYHFIAPSSLSHFLDLSFMNTLILSPPQYKGGNFCILNLVMIFSVTLCKIK